MLWEVAGGLDKLFDVKNYGVLVRLKRGEAKITQQTLAADVFGDEGRKGDISRIENGKQNPQEATIQKINSALAITEAEMVEIRQGRTKVQKSEKPGRSLGPPHQNTLHKNDVDSRTPHNPSEETKAHESVIPLNEEIVEVGSAERAIGGMESFQYARRRDDFVARGELVNQVVEEFLDFEGDFSRDTAFRWTLVYGDAGIGKSRFALETLFRLFEKKSEKFPKKYWGFVKRDRVDASLTLSKEKIQAWSIDGPAFLILDYAGTNRDLVEIVRELKARAILLEQPIRLMLLERRNDSGRVSDLDRIDSAEGFLRDTCYETNKRRVGDGIGIRLEQLDARSTASLMRQRILRERGFLLDRETDPELLRRLDDVCRDDRRPLFAAMVASAISDEVSDGATQPNAAEKDLLKERSATLRYLIRRERDNFWRTPDDSGTLKVLGEHENLLALATFTRGLDISIFDEAEELTKAKLPSVETFDVARYSRMSTTEQGSDLVGLPIGFLEPDFIGEWFVISRLSPEAKLDVSVPLNRPDIATIVDLAWNHGRERAAQFVSQCHQNHPDEVRSLGYLLPQAGRHTELVVALLKDFLLDWRRSLSIIGDKFNEDATIESAKLVARRATEVFEILQKHVNKAKELSENTRNDIADATDTFVFIRSWIISPKLRRKRDEGLMIRATGSTASQSRSPIDTSLRIQEILRSSALSEPAINEVTELTNSVGVSFAEFGNALRLTENYNRKSKRPPQPRTDAETRKSGAPVYELAGRLLSDAADFFRALGENNDPLKEQMEENATVFSQMASLLVQSPEGELNGSAYSELAGKLLIDGAGFFRSLAEQNESLRDQMLENSNVYDQIGKMVMDDPLQWLD